MSTPSNETRNRLDPEVLAEDATNLLATAGDVHALVVSLLKTCRQNDDTENAIRQGYEFTSRLLEDQLRAAETERNEYREALRAVRRATRNLRLGRP